jgi:hypothetical protein
MHDLQRGCGERGRSKCVEDAQGDRPRLRSSDPGSVERDSLAGGVGREGLAVILEVPLIFDN